MWDLFFIKEGKKLCPFFCSLCQPVMLFAFFLVVLSGMRILKGQVWTLHRCLGPCTFQSGKTWCRAVGRNSLRLSQPLGLCILLCGRSLEVKDASWCSHLKGREGYRKQEKKIHWLGDQNIIPARTWVSESWINESAPRELIHVNTWGLKPGKAKGQSD